MLQGLPPILPEGDIRALILGSFPSVQSLERQQYYAHPQNWFWRVMQHCGVVEDARAAYDQRVGQVRARRLAIWDLYEQVRREGSGDDQIRDAVPNDIAALLDARGPAPSCSTAAACESSAAPSPTWRRTSSPCPAPAPARCTGTPRPQGRQRSRSGARPWPPTVAEIGVERRNSGSNPRICRSGLGIA